MPLKRAHHLAKRAERHGLFDRVNMTGGAFAIVRGLQALYGALLWQSLAVPTLLGCSHPINGGGQPGDCIGHLINAVGQLFNKPVCGVVSAGRYLRHAWPSNNLRAFPTERVVSCIEKEPRLRLLSAECLAAFK